ncbi:MAG: cytochrome c oxidase, subunit [Spartobacteria bacterium]|nr:cytochrome c oxidase, subunit [Spartobacteria bacterium]
MDRFRLIPPEASSSAQQVDWLFLAITAVMLFFTVMVFFPIAWFAIKYRQGSKADRSNPSHGSNLIEVGWTIFPIIVGIALFSWGAITFYQFERPPANALQVQVVGKQWMWKLQHAEGKREIDELHVPVGQPVTLTMTSQDVIHSFFIPAFRVKKDVVPGKYTTEWFKPTRLGEYHIFCSQYCGTQHSRMIGRVLVMEPVAYERWLTTGDAAESIALAGERLFRDRGCSGCHGTNSQFHAPPLEGIYGKPVPLSTGEIVTADDQYMRDSILLPAKQIAAGYENIMPSYTGQLGEEEIMQLIAYLKSIAGNQPSGTAGILK